MNKVPCTAKPEAQVVGDVELHCVWEHGHDGEHAWHDAAGLPYSPLPNLPPTSAEQNEQMLEIMRSQAEDFHKTTARNERIDAERRHMDKVHRVHLRRQTRALERIAATLEVMLDRKRSGLP
jgi:hypothetical protein